MPLRITFATFLTLAACASAVPAAAQQADLLSRPSDPLFFDRYGTDSIFDGHLSGDGQRIVFPSASFNLVPGDRNASTDIFLLNRSSGQLRLVSVNSQGAQANATSRRARISGNGRYVIFDSLADNLVPGVGNGENAVFRHDTTTGAVDWVSAHPDGGPFDNDAFNEDMDWTGNMVAFRVSGQLYVRDIQAGTTQLVSVTPLGGPGNGFTNSARLAADGSFVAFSSTAADLVPGDTNNVPDIFVRELPAGPLTRLLAPGGVEFNGTSTTLQGIADAGRLLLFASSSDNLVPDDTNQDHDIFVHDRVTGNYQRVSVGSGGEQGDGGSYDSAISADGRFVLIDAQAANLAPGGAEGVRDLYLRDRQLGTTQRIFAPGTMTTFNPEMAGSGGQFLGLFVAYAPDLTPGGINNKQLLLYDSASGSTEVVGLAETPVPVTIGSNDSEEPVLSLDGRYLAFSSGAGNLVGQAPVSQQVMRLDLETGLLTLVSVPLDGVFDGWFNERPAISANGNRIAFESRSRNLVPGVVTSIDDIYLRDVNLGQTRRVSVSSDGIEGDGDSSDPAISADGSVVAFMSRAANLVTGDSNDDDDIFVHVLATATTSRVSLSSEGVEANNHSDHPDISATGRYVVFESDASNLVPDDSNGRSDIFLHDRATGETRRLSVGSQGAQADDDSVTPRISSNGRMVVFASEASNLAPPGGLVDGIFVHDTQTGTTQRVSLGTDGLPLVGELVDPRISGDGSAVMFRHSPDGAPDQLYLHRISQGRSFPLLLRVDGSPSDAFVRPGGLDASGMLALFESADDRLVADDVNGSEDIFLVDIDRLFRDDFDGQ